MRIFSGPTKIAFGFGLGIAAAGMVKEMAPAFRGLGRPLLKATIKSAIVFARESQSQFAGLRETLADVKAEVDAELGPAAPASEPGAPQFQKRAAGVM